MLRIKKSLKNDTGTEFAFSSLAQFQRVRFSDEVSVPGLGFGADAGATDGRDFGEQ